MKNGVVVVVEECGWWCSRPSLARNWYCTANLYVTSSLYAVECPTPFGDPAVASEMRNQSGIGYPGVENVK